MPPSLSTGDLLPCQANLEMSGFCQNRNVRYSCSDFLSFLAHIKQSSPGMILGRNWRFSPNRTRRLFLRFLRFFWSYGDLPELHRLSRAPDGHGAVRVFLHHQFPCLHCLFDLIELSVMSNRKVITDCPFCLDAEDPIEVQPPGTGRWRFSACAAFLANRRL